MNGWQKLWTWLTDPVHWSGPAGIPARVGEHLGYAGITLLIAMAIAIPLGLWVGHTGRGMGVVLGFTGGMRALPTLGLLTALALVFGLGLAAPLIALVILAIPPLLAPTASGLRAINRRTIEASRAIGMSSRQILLGVELPLAIPPIMGGIRSAAIQVIATWTVAAFLPLGGLGRYLIDGLAVRDYPQMLGGSVVVIILVLIVDMLLAGLTRLVTPTGVRVSRTRRDPS